MRCPKCTTENDADANFCTHCGHTLGDKTGKNARRRWVWGLLCLIILAFGLALLRYGLSPGPEDTGDTGKDVQHRPSAGAPDLDPVAPNAGPRKDDGPTGPGAVGWVVIRNPQGKEVRKILTSAVSGSWVALPSRACYGGDHWTFFTGSREPILIESGVWSEGIPLSLWRLEEGNPLSSPALHPWNDQIPVTWHALESGVSTQLTDVFIEKSEGDVLTCPLPDNVEETGVFMQENHVVGWTFPPWTDRGFLWNGPEGGELEEDTWVEHFYGMTFASGREEQFSMALAMDGSVDPRAKLEALAEGFRLEPRLSLEDTPAGLRPGAVIDTMRELTQRMLQREQYQDLADTLDEQVIQQVRDPDLLMDSARAAANYYGFPSGIRFFEELHEAVLAADEGQVSRIRLFHRKLYADWLRQYLEERNPIHGWPAFDQAKRLFPQDPEIHLLGVELALAENNWEKADRLLDVMDYPEALEAKARSVREAIDGHRRKEGKIVIRFRPGSRFIPVSATVNGIFQQDFVIDTGATLVSIPSSTVQALGIAIGDDTPKRRISTAGGTRVVPEITLASIRLENQTVRQIKAFVLDIPDNPNIGLLGLNFLRRFRMEIDNEKGLLVLNPQ